MANIKIGELDKVLNKKLELYSDQVTTKVKNITDKATKELVKNTKKDANKKTGDYAKAITSKTIFENKRSKVNVWYVKNGEHRLSHLLEKGHALKSGGRTKAYKFISKNEEIAINSFNKQIREAIENGP